MRVVRAAPRALVLVLALVLLLELGVRPMLGAAIPTAAETDPMSVGFTFSPRQAEYLGLPWRDTFRAAMQLGPSLVRLGAYWDEIERRPGRYDFSTLDWLLDEADGHKLRVILTVGMKAPRWPEYYLPGWLEQQVALPRGAQVSDDPRVRAATLEFIDQVVRRYRDREVIAYWQVENEPLDPAGPKSWRIGADFLAEEVAHVRNLDSRGRPIIVNQFVETHPLAILPIWRDATQARARTILGLADIIGLDVYPIRGIRIMGHDVDLDWPIWIWERPVRDLQRLAESAGKPAWVMEAQAEPWWPASVRPARAADNVSQLRTAGFPTVLMWGVEHWYWQLLRHDDGRWWDAMGRLFGAGSPAPPPPDRA